MNNIGKFWLNFKKILKEPENNLIKQYENIKVIIISFWTTSIYSELEYKLNFIIEFVSVVGNLIGSIFILSLFYLKGKCLSLM